MVCGALWSGRVCLSDNVAIVQMFWKENAAAAPLKFLVARLNSYESILSRLQMMGLTFSRSDATDSTLLNLRVSSVKTLDEMRFLGFDYSGDGSHWYW